MTNNGINVSSVFEILPISNSEMYTKKPCAVNPVDPTVKRRKHVEIAVRCHKKKSTRSNI